MIVGRESTVPADRVRAERLDHGGCSAGQSTSRDCLFVAEGVTMDPSSSVLDRHEAEPALDRGMGSHSMRPGEDGFGLRLAAKAADGEKAAS